MNLLRKLFNKPEHKVLYVKYFEPYSSENELKYTGDWVDVRVNSTPLYLNDDGNFKKYIPTAEIGGKTVYKVHAGDVVKVPLGFGLILPKHHEAIIKPRSSLSKNTGLLFATSGVIDEGYCGENDQWFVCFYATRNCDLYLGERVAQFRIQKKQPELEFVTVAKLKETSRGGHGSTGRF